MSAGEQEVKVLYLDGRQDERGLVVRSVEWVPVASVFRVSKPMTLDCLRNMLCPLPPATMQAQQQSTMTGDRPLGVLNAVSTHQSAAQFEHKQAGTSKAGQLSSSDGDYSMRETNEDEGREEQVSFVDEGDHAVVPVGPIFKEEIEGGNCRSDSTLMTMPGEVSDGKKKDCPESTVKESSVCPENAQKGGDASAPESASTPIDTGGTGCNEESGAPISDARHHQVRSLCQVLQDWASASNDEVARLKKRLLERHPKLPPKIRILSKPHVIIDGSGRMRYKVCTFSESCGGWLRPRQRMIWTYGGAGGHQSSHGRTERRAPYQR